MERLQVSAFNVRAVEGDSGHFSWRGSDGIDLSECPFSYDETRNGGFDNNNSKLRFGRSLGSGGGQFSRAFLEAADFSAAEIPRADFSYACLRMADFSQALLRQANFRFADLTFSELNNATLVNADFSFADLCKASLRGACLSFANFTQADLEHADFRGADIRGATFKDVDWRFAHIAGAIFDTRTILPFSILEARRLKMVEAPLKSPAECLRGGGVGLRPGGIL